MGGRVLDRQPTEGVGKDIQSYGNIRQRRSQGGKYSNLERRCSHHQGESETGRTAIQLVPPKRKLRKGKSSSRERKQRHLLEKKKNLNIGAIFPIQWEKDFRGG